jgi:hypothetical protein
MGFNGNLSFNTQPLNCPIAQFPEGVNIFEFIINNSFQEGNPQETIDISCVAGVNCIIKAELYGGNHWNASPLYSNVTKMENSGILNNHGRVGVYPYSCDVCIGMKNPPQCAHDDKDKQSAPICNVQRNAKESGGGVVRVAYLGGLIPMK